MSGRVTYGLSGISGNKNAYFPINVPNGTFTFSGDVQNPSQITTISTVTSTWDSGQTMTIKITDPTVELYTAEKCGFAQTNNSLLAIANGEVGLAVTQDATEIDRLRVDSSIIRQYETISVASQNYNVTASSPKTYLIEPNTANTNKIIFNDANIVDGTTYSFYNMSNGAVTVESNINSTILPLMANTTQWATQIFITPDNSKIIAIFAGHSSVNQVRMFNALTGALINGHNIAGNSQRGWLSKDGTKLVYVNGGQVVKYTVGSTLNLETGFAINHTAGTPVMAVINNNNSRIITCSDQQSPARGDIRCFDYAGTLQWELVDAVGTSNRLYRLHVPSGNDTTFFAAGQNGNIRQFNISDGSTVRTFTPPNVKPQTEVYGIDTNAAYTRLAVAGNNSGTTNSILRVFDIATGTNLLEDYLLDEPTGGINTGNTQAVKFTPDDQYIVTGGVNNKIRVINASTYIPVQVNYLNEPPDVTINSVSFNSQGEIFVASGTNILKINNFISKITQYPGYHVLGAKFFNNLVDYTLTGQSILSSFNLPQFSACHIKVCKISNIEMYFFVNMTVNSN